MPERKRSLPGPLGANMPQDYAACKNGKKSVTYPIRGCEDILDETYGVIPYQEQIMAISKRIAGFDDMQADSLTRKTIAKKKIAMMPMLIRCHIFGKRNCEGSAGWENDMHAPWYDPEGKYGGEIEGAVHRGYTEEEVLAYFKTIEKFSSYCFNKSHAACYAYISFLTAWLKFYYPTEFMAALLSMQEEAEDIAMYVKVCEQKLHIKVATPDINISETDFTPSNGEILYGLGSVKGVGEKAIPEILAARPFASVEDAVNKIPKKSFNKRSAENLIKAGAFDFENGNRLALLNELHEIRKDKGIEPYVTEAFGEDLVIEMETETLGAPITYKPWWDTVPEGKRMTVRGTIRATNERKDKRGRLMAFPELKINKCIVNGLIFASSYAKCAIDVDEHYLQQAEYEFEFTGRKDDKGKFILDSIKSVKIEEGYEDMAG